ncbi:MAG: hypothetical protein ACXW2Y_07240 [Acidimicrobiia bacterium]
MAATAATIAYDDAVVFGFSAIDRIIDADRTSTWGTSTWGTSTGSPEGVP